jgi:hypothetical protein
VRASEFNKSDGAKSIVLHKKGQHFTGTLLEEPVLRTKMKFGGAMGEVDTWDNGDAKKEWMFTFSKESESICDCEEWCDSGAKHADRGGPDDTGIRKLYAAPKSNLLVAITDSLGSGDLNPGDRVKITRTGVAPREAGYTGKPKVTYSAEHTPGEGGGTSDAPPADPWDTAPSTASEPPPLTAAQIAATQAALAAMTPAQRQDMGLPPFDHGMG